MRQGKVGYSEVDSAVARTLEELIAAIFQVSMVVVTL